MVALHHLEAVEIIEQDCKTLIYGGIVIEMRKVFKNIIEMNQWTFVINY